MSARRYRRIRWRESAGEICWRKLVRWRAVDFEKWQALGNDYLIVEHENLPFELTPERIRRICAGHFGVFADGILLISAPTELGFVASLRIFNPDGSEAELSGNGAREAILYLRARGRAAADQFSIQTPAGEIRATVTSPTTCAVDMGRARLRSEDYPSGPADGSGELIAGGRTGASSTPRSATRSARSGSTTATSSSAWR